MMFTTLVTNLTFFNILFRLTIFNYPSFLLLIYFFGLLDNNIYVSFFNANVTLYSVIVTFNVFSIDFLIFNILKIIFPILYSNLWFDVF